MPFPIATGLMNKRNSSISPNLIKDESNEPRVSFRKKLGFLRSLHILV